MGDSSSKANDESFGFGFNDKDFSDRILRIEIIPKDSDDCVATEGDCLHVNSLILAAKSPFFYKLFKNGMIESQSKVPVLRIYSSEKASLMELLKFMYQSTLSATTNYDLLAVLIVADKFEVASCMRYCIQQLLKMSMSLEFALSYLDLPSTILVAEVVKPLVDASKCYLVERYKKFNKLMQEKALALPLAAVEFVLGSEGLEVNSEDDVFDFVLRWSRRHYLEPNERKKIITKSLAKLIRFQYMSCWRLKKVLVQDEFKHEDVTKLVVEALFFKVEVPYGSPLGRHYKYRLIKVVEIEKPRPQCIIFFDLKKQECENLFSSKRMIYFQKFFLGGQCFLLSAAFGEEHFAVYLEFGEEHFAVYLGIGEESQIYGFKFAAMKKSTMEFESQCKDKDYIYIGKTGRVFRGVIGIPWTTFISDDSDYFIDGILHLRVELTIINS